MDGAPHWLDGPRRRGYARVHGIRDDSAVGHGPAVTRARSRTEKNSPSEQASFAHICLLERALSQTELLVLADTSLELHVQGRTHRLAARAPYIVVRELARERLKDRAHGVAPADEGWLDRQLLDVRLRRPDLNQDIARIRADFRKLQLFQAAQEVIETHREQGKVRLGIARVRLEQ
jgi:hypothetical protein